jgi:hypothetical protein
MRKYVVLLLLYPISGYCQTRADIFGNTPIIWLGLDFSHVKYIGRATQFNKIGEVSNAELQTKYFPTWNDMIFKEHEKFDVAAAVHRDFVGCSMLVTENENGRSTRTYFTGKADEYQLLTADSISAFVANYNFGQKKGIGLLFFVEGMNKKKMEASMWVTFVEMSSKKVLLAKRMTGMPGGTGFRNFWARSFFNVLWDMRQEFPNWK